MNRTPFRIFPANAEAQAYRWARQLREMAARWQRLATASTRSTAPTGTYRKAQ